MEILIAVACISVVELIVLGVTLRSVDRADERQARAELERAAAAHRTPPRFMSASVAASDRVPLEALLAQLERHVRLEHQAAESFLRNPTPESLHRHAPSSFHLSN